MAEPAPDWDDSPEARQIDRQPFLARLAGAPDDDGKAALLVEAANLLPPWELKRIYARLRKEYGRDNVPPALARSAVLWQQLKNQEVQRYDTVEYGPCVTLYRVLPRPRRPALLICFAGKENRMFSLTSRLIHAIDHPELDIVLIRHAPGCDFRSGVPGFGRNLFQIGEALERSLGVSRYDRVATFGVSMGAIPALALARQIGAGIGLSLSGRYPGMIDPSPLARSGTAFEALCDCRPLASMQTAAIFGARNPEDAATALRLARLDPGIDLLPIPDLEDHNAIAYLTMRRKLALFYEGFLDAILNGARLADRFRADIDDGKGGVSPPERRP